MTQSSLTRCLRTLLIVKDQVKKRISDLWGEAPYIDIWESLNWTWYRRLGGQVSELEWTLES